jgi:hypothetical protein
MRAATIQSDVAARPRLGNGVASDIVSRGSQLNRARSLLALGALASG